MNELHASFYTFTPLPYITLICGFNNIIINQSSWSQNISKIKKKNKNYKEEEDNTLIIIWKLQTYQRKAGQEVGLG